MTWREMISGIYADSPRQAGIAVRPEFYPAAKLASIAAAETDLSATFPDSLRSLLLESNGVMAIDGGEWFETWWLISTVEEIVDLNRDYRAEQKRGNYERDFDRLMIFAGAGVDGILFAFPVEDGVCAPRVVVWHPIMDELDDAAPSLEDFVRGWVMGTISV